jgi:imidazolonepropionase
MNLTIEEALIGATLNAAVSIDRDDTIGSLEPGKQFDAVIVNGMLTDLISVGGPVIRQVVKRGRVVVVAVGA